MPIHSARRKPSPIFRALLLRIGRLSSSGRLVGLCSANARQPVPPSSRPSRTSQELTHIQLTMLRVALVVALFAISALAAPYCANVTRNELSFCFVRLLCGRVY